MDKFEKVVIAVTLITGLLGGVILSLYHLPAIVTSIFFSIAISVLVYHFLGGIKTAGFNMGPVKLGGSIAALIGCTYFINYFLADQQNYNPNQQLLLNSEYKVFNNNNDQLGTLNLSKYPISINQKHQVFTNNTFVGTLSDSIFTCLNYYDRIGLNDYIEIYYNLTMSPFSSEIVFDTETESGLDFKNSYNKLPFTVKPVFSDGSDKTLIRFKDSINQPIYHELKKGASIVLNQFLESKKKLYIIRVRQLDRIVPDCFAQYQIIELNYRKTNRENIN
ncbi:MAG: hypothetical protein PHH37_00470 [Paludibacter sp.]|nr:hypothetical protein [Paludibacter sp.]